VIGGCIKSLLRSSSCAPFGTATTDKVPVIRRTDGSITTVSRTVCSLKDATNEVPFLLQLVECEVEKKRRYIISKKGETYYEELDILKKSSIEVDDIGEKLICGATRGKNIFEHRTLYKQQ
jgi:hypothetical protein